MNIRNVNVFLTLMRTRSATSTATLTGISQPAVSQIIRQIEHELGLKLFVLLNGRLTPTPEADQIATEMSQIAHANDRMRGLANDLRDNGKGLLRIATLTASHVFIPDAISALNKVAPHAIVDIRISQGFRIIDAVTKGEADIGIVTTNVDPELTRYKDLADMNAVAVVPLKSELSDLPFVTPASLRDHRILSYDPHVSFGQRAGRIFAAANERFEVGIHVASTTLLCALVEKGVGVGLIEPFFAVGPDRFQVRVKLFKPYISMKLRLILPANRPQSILAQHFQRFFEISVRQLIDRYKKGAAG